MITRFEHDFNKGKQSLLH